MNLKICGARLLVKPLQLEEADSVYKAAKKAGIAIPESDEKRREQAALDKGVVIQVGALAWFDWGDGTPWAKVGDSVIWARHAGKVVEVDNERYLILNDEDVIAVTGEK